MAIPIADMDAETPAILIELKAKKVTAIQFHPTEMRISALEA